MTICVTQEIIDNSIHNKNTSSSFLPSGDCPVSVALSLAFGEKITSAMGSFGGTKNQGSLPDEVYIFMQKFDNDQPVKPFEFDTIPQLYL